MQFIDILKDFGTSKIRWIFLDLTDVRRRNISKI
jgi:hypothetical protein